MEIRAGFEVMILSVKNSGDFKRDDVFKIEKVINGKYVKAEHYDDVINLDDYIFSVRNPSDLPKLGDRIKVLKDLTSLDSPIFIPKGRAMTVKRIDWHGTVYTKQGGIPIEDYQIIN